MVLLVLLLIGDALCIAGHLVLVATGSDSWAWHLGAESGYGEAYQHLKQLWAVVLLTVLAVRHRSAVLWAWLVVTVYFLADDAGNVHESVGRWVIATYPFTPAFGDQRTQLVEVLWMAGVGLVLAAAVLVAHRRAASAVRRVSWRFAALYAGLVVVGIVLDGLHLAVDDIPVLDVVLTVLEDGGELVLVSGIVAYAFHLVTSRTGPPPVAAGR